MSSAIPTRRTTRVTRATAVKENQNANTRTTRMTTRAKPTLLVSGTSSTVAPATSGIARPTLASKAKATSTENKTEFHAGKRKREALGEVAVAVNKPARAPLKGKEREVLDGVILKPRAVGAVRQPLRTVVTRQTTTKTTTVVDTKEATAKRSEAKDAIRNDQAMVVDPPPKVPLPSITTRRSNVSTKVPAGAGHNRAVSQSLRTRIQEYEEPVQKKRRTSSPLPEEEIEEASALAEEKARHDRLVAEIQAFANEVEHDPENSPWDDLDAEDNDDPLMVSEYVQEIFTYMKKLELITMPNPNYMDSQKELAWKMRGILTDWLIQVHVRFRLLPETLFLCVNIIDRFLSARIVSLAKLQLVGITCMFIAAKFEEIIAPSVSHFLTCADSSYTEGEILQAERYVLKTLDWNLSYPSPVHFLRRISKADEYNVKVRTLAKYLLEIAILEWRLIAAPPSLLAAASIWLARLALGMENWTPNLAHYSSYRESALVPTANLMLNYILKPIKHESFYKKYAGKRYFKSSIFMREWALDRWSESTQVDLAKDLCRLKAEIKLEREEEEAAQLMREDSRDLAADYAALQQLRARGGAIN